MRSIDSSFYKASAWRRCQQAYIKHCNGLCERCLSKGLIVPARIVHHKIHLNENNVSDPCIAYGFENLEALCIDCHNKEHFGESKQRFKYVNGELVFTD